MKITNCPSTLAEGYDTYSPTALRRMFENKKVSHQLDFNNDKAYWVEIDERIRKISISGVQEKLSAVMEKGKIQLTPTHLQGKYIIKPIPNNKRLENRHFMPANEHLTMQIARQIFNITTAENALIFFANDEPAYITKRFDFNAENQKIAQEDFASLEGKTKQTGGENFKYSGCYLDAKKIFDNYVAASKIELTKFFKLVLFNYIFSNGDAHFKNFSLQQTPNGDYMLTPAYDLMNSSLHVNDNDFALDGGLFPKTYYSETYERKGHPCRTDFETFGKLLEIPSVQIAKITTEFATKSDEVYQLINQSFLDERMKRIYCRSYDERMSRFNRR